MIDNQTFEIVLQALQSASKKQIEIITIEAMNAAAKEGVNDNIAFELYTGRNSGWTEEKDKIFQEWVWSFRDLS
jgi:hypothetical protein